MANVYSYRDARGLSVSAQIVGETIDRIEAEEGLCKPGRLVEEARPEGSPLHRLFTWDDNKAAEKWRKEEARRVINSIAVTVRDNDGEPHMVQAFQSVGHIAATREHGGGYRSIMAIVRDEAMSDELLDQAIRNLAAYRRQYSEIVALTEVWKAIDDARMTAAIRKNRRRW